MTYHFSIDGSSDKAIALLEFLRTLDFVTEENHEFILTDQHAEILEKRRNNRMSGKSKTYSWDEVKDTLGQEKAG